MTDAPLSVQKFVGSLTCDSGDDLEHEDLEAVYLVYCEAVGFEPIEVEDLRRNIEALDIETTPEGVPSLGWDGLAEFLEDNRDALDAVENRFSPENPEKAVRARERHVSDRLADLRPPRRRAEA